MLAGRLRPLDETVIDLASAYFDVDPDDVRGLSRARTDLDARHVSSWVLRESGWTYAKIAKAVNRDHSTIMSSITNVNNSERLLSAAQILLARVSRDTGEGSDIMLEKRHADHVIASLEAMRDRSGIGAVKRVINYYMEMVQANE